MSTKPNFVIFPVGSEAAAASYASACGAYLTAHGQSANAPWNPSPLRVDFYGQTVCGYLGPGNAGWDSMYPATDEPQSLIDARDGGAVAAAVQWDDPNAPPED